ncbi:MAG: glycosyltransferase family 1 protein [Desulfobacterales bacterium]|nr:glycosyltransferase family 1 protein [Desulfobacterales bacterium]
MERRLKIALIGTRGVPAKYGGFETCVEEVGKRLAEKGHEVTVYCRKSYYAEKKAEHLGMKLVHLPNMARKSLDTLSHTFFSVCHAVFKRYDIYMVFNAANSFLLFPLRLLGKKIAVNTDGLEWKRSKWGFWGRQYYRAAEKVACLVANRLVSDSRGIREHYRKTHGTESVEIAYGAYLQHCERPNRLAEVGVRPGEYFLQITRFEPENHPLLTIQAFRMLNTDKKLVLVGGNPYANEYTGRIDSERDDHVLLPGFIYDQELLTELWCLCHAYVHGNSVGGTNPALLQSMASGCFVMAVDNPFNRDVLSDCGAFYSPDADSLAERMQWSLDNGDALDDFRRRARLRIEARYCWDKVADQYEQLFFELARGQSAWQGS